MLQIMCWVGYDLWFVFVGEFLVGSVGVCCWGGLIHLDCRQQFNWRGC